MTPPPPAEQLTSRAFLGPALRTQPDRRLVTLVREGYEVAFEEIVRRYRRPLDRFAASFVGGRSEDVTQDAFSKALLALRGSEAEIELRPWLYRIVRNTALNDLRDRPPSTEELGEAIAGGRSAAAEAEGREEMAELMNRLRALPEPQRAAIVMRELEGLSHEEIAASLGLSGGAARQVIYRARQALRGGFGMLVPLPLLRALLDHGNEVAGAGAGGAVATAGAASGGGAGAALGGLGAGGALKVGLATALIAGSVGAGVALDHGRGGHRDREASTSSALALPASDLNRHRSSGRQEAFEDTALRGGGTNGGRNGGGFDDGGRNGGDRGRHRSPGGGRDDGISAGSNDPDDSSHQGSGSSPDGPSGHGGGSSDGGGGGGGGGDSSGSGKSSGEGSSGGGTSGSGQSGRHSSGESGSGDGGGPGESSSGGGHEGDDDSGSGGGGSGGGSGGSGDSPASSEPAPVAAPAPVEETPSASGGDGFGGGDSGSGGGPGSGNSSGGEDDS
jgi:RNA polymerase sigma factor (sigma-70 family)